MTFTIPNPLKLEHEDLHCRLVTVIIAGGKLDERGRTWRMFSMSIIKEEAFALPPLRFLSV